MKSENTIHVETTMLVSTSAHDDTFRNSSEISPFDDLGPWLPDILVDDKHNIEQALHERSRSDGIEYKQRLHVRLATGNPLYYGQSYSAMIVRLSNGNVHIPC